MYFHKNPSDKIINNNADELLIITGYLSPSIFEELFDVKRYNKVRVFVGMYSKIDQSIKDSLLLQMEKYSELEIYYTTQRVHIKTYFFYKDNNLISILNGSLNFTTNAFYKNVESLSTVDLNNDPKAITALFNFVEKEIILKSIPLSEMKTTSEKQSVASKNIADDSFDMNENSITFSLLSKRRGQENLIGVISKAGEVGSASGYNWGFSNGGPKINDAYIPLSSEIFRQNPDFFITMEGNVIDLILPNSDVITMKLEGIQKIDGVRYPKQMSGYKNKSRLGIFLREYIKEISGIDTIIPPSITKEIIRKDSDKSKYNKYLITKEILDNSIGDVIKISRVEDSIFRLEFPNAKK